jgi:hypothetical protein
MRTCSQTTSRIKATFSNDQVQAMIQSISKNTRVVSKQPAYEIYISCGYAIDQKLQYIFTMKLIKIFMQKHYQFFT